MRCLVALAALCVSPAIGMDWRTAAAPTPFVTAVAAAPVGGKPPKAAPVERLAFTSASCVHCRGLTVPAGVRIVDFDANEALAAECGVEALPAYVVRQGGKVLRREQGVKTFAQAEAFYGGDGTAADSTVLRGGKAHAGPAVSVVGLPSGDRPNARDVPPVSAGVRLREPAAATTYTAAPAAPVAVIRYEEPAPVPAVVADPLPPPGWHSHKCENRNCGHVWMHPDTGGNHNCPNCGRVETDIYRHGPGYSSGKSGRRSGGGLFGWGWLD